VKGQPRELKWHEVGVNSKTVSNKEL
jgi:hypothetical protein